MPFIIISVLIIIHELGHFLTALLLKIEVDKIYIYPFGGISKFNLSLNTSIKKELLILLMGPLFQELAKYLLILIFKEYEFMIITYHYSILFFNLLPIYPLDGGKLVNLFLSCFFPLKKSLHLSIYLSYIIILFIFLINTNSIHLNIIIISIFLITKVSKEDSQINLVYQKFLLERYLHHYNFKDTKIIKNKNNFYRNKKHLLKIKDKYYYEDEFLAKNYKNLIKKVDNKKNAVL